MTAPNYVYDKLGQLVADYQENTSYTWRYGDKKLKSTASSLPDGPEIDYVYNPLGQRILKIVKPKIDFVPLDDSTWIYEYYAYDANGQVMSTYEIKIATYNTAKLNEQMIYGASRSVTRTAISWSISKAINV